MCWDRFVKHLLGLDNCGTGLSDSGCGTGWGVCPTDLGTPGQATASPVRQGRKGPKGVFIAFIGKEEGRGRQAHTSAPLVGYIPSLNWVFAAAAVPSLNDSADRLAV
jgi:hypothetical protein